MRYFKPELLARSRSQDDEVAEAAAKEWEEATAGYEARFNVIAPRLPGGAGELCSRFSLHDAKVLGAAFATEKAMFVILLRLEGASGQIGKVLELNYLPMAGPTGGVAVKPNASLQGRSHKDVWVLYDEFDFNEECRFCTHSLLLTDGREIEVRFTDMKVLLLDEVVTPGYLTEGERKWPTVSVVG